MKELEEFTVERLEEMHKSLKEGLKLGFADALILRDVVKIALAAKRHSIAMIPDEKPDEDGPLADGWNACRAKMLYTTQKPAHTEQVVPDGWKLVPIEPTEGMLDEFDSIIDFGADDSVDAWKRLIAAAPKPETE